MSEQGLSIHPDLIREHLKVLERQLETSQKNPHFSPRIRRSLELDISQVKGLMEFAVQQGGFGGGEGVGGEISGGSSSGSSPGSGSYAVDGAVGSRKRTRNSSFDNYLGEDSREPDWKSHRTTPSSVNTAATSPLAGNAPGASENGGLDAGLGGYGRPSLLGGAESRLDLMMDKNDGPSKMLGGYGGGTGGDYGYAIELGSAEQEVQNRTMEMFRRDEELARALQEDMANPDPPPAYIEYEDGYFLPAPRARPRALRHQDGLDLATIDVIDLSQEEENDKVELFTGISLPANQEIGMQTSAAANQHQVPHIDFDVLFAPLNNGSWGAGSTFNPVFHNNNMDTGNSWADAYYAPPEDMDYLSINSTGVAPRLPPISSITREPSPLHSFQDSYGKEIDEQGSIFNDEPKNMLNDGWPVPDDGGRRTFFKQEVHDYINHVRNDPTKTMDEIKNLLENIRPDMEIPPEDREGTPPALVYPLMEHQKLGLAWMKSMEEGSNKGGILADDMGLGKTIQALALIVSRKSKDPERKTNLIVAPVALLKQWEREIKKKIKAEHALTVCVHHGNSKKAKSFADLAKYDVVLTTFGTIAAEYKKLVHIQREIDEGSYNEANASPNFFFVGKDCRWFRVIIDEAQCIKNKDTQSAKGCCALEADYRLCLSGTPMQNNCDELFSLLRFLKIRPYDEWQRFAIDFSRPLKGKTGTNITWALQKLQALLKAILLRRTKDSKIDGRPILALPEKTIEMVHAVFSEDEHAFYSALETKSQFQFNRYIRSNAIGRNYSNILVLLLRLRQACCHPHLIKDIEIPTSNELSEDKMLELARELPPDAVARIKDCDALECPICMDAADNPSIVVPCGHEFCSECLVRVYNQHAESNLARGDESSKARCPGCRGELSLQKVIDLRSFNKIYQPELVQPKNEDEERDDDLIYDTDSDGDDDSSGSGEDSDGDDGSDLEDFVVPDDDSGADSGANSRQKSKKKAKKAKKLVAKGKEKARPRTLAEVRKDAMRNNKSKKLYMKHLKKRWVSSAKVDKCVEILSNIRSKDTTEKTIIFSQFTSLLDLLEVPIHSNGWKYKRYDGSMSATNRNQALIDFTDDPNVNIILVSLKAGNSGLNLVAASQVIILDPFYNPFVEHQAIDRAHRIGQQRQVMVHRIIVEGTIEDRVLALQDKKRKLVEGALDETALKGIARLTARDLGFLFGVPTQ